MDKYKIIKKLYKLKEDHPEQVITIETPRGSVSFKIGDVKIYESRSGEIIIDKRENRMMMIYNREYRFGH